MKHRNLILVRLIAIACATAFASDAQTQQPVGPMSITVESLSSVTSPAQIMPRPIKHGRNQVLQGSFPDIKGGMVKEMGSTTSAMVEQEAQKKGALDNWLIALAALGLIVLQLRHKHKSLPQRRITPYG
jgi:hypothetical protein